MISYGNGKVAIERRIRETIFCYFSNLETWTIIKQVCFLKDEKQETKMLSNEHQFCNPIEFSMAN